MNNFDSAHEMLPDHLCESHKLGVEIWGVYDGVLYWQCAVCKKAWHRWPEGHDLRRRAARYVEEAPRD